MAFFNCFFNHFVEMLKKWLKNGRVYVPINFIPNFATRLENRKKNTASSARYRSPELRSGFLKRT